MKHSLIIVAALLCGSSAFAKLYEATPASDLNAMISALAPGDTLMLSPGTYRPVEAHSYHRQGPYAVVYDVKASGEQGAPVCILGKNAPDGSRPLFDLSQVNPWGYRITGFLIEAEWVKLANFDITGIQVNRTDHSQSENIRIADGSHCTVDNISIHDGMGIGVYINKQSAHNLVINCDAFNQYDPISDAGKGGNNDGFGCHVKADCPGNLFIGCRAWNNTDDGFDLINCYSPVTFEYSIAYHNGYDAQGVSRADGNGFKAGGYGMKARNIELDTVPRHTVSHSLAIANKANGHYANHHLGGVNFRNNTAIDNGNFNYSFVNRRGPGADDNVDVNGYGHQIRSNLSASRRGRHFTWLPATDGILQVARFTPIGDVEPLLAPRLANGNFDAPTLRFISSLTPRNRAGADFRSYLQALLRARHTTGADAQ